MSYNGWSNWETWNVELWAMNDENAYRFIRARLNECETLQECDEMPETCKALAFELFPDGTPDMESADEMERVHWCEIAESWSELV